MPRGFFTAKRRGTFLTPGLVGSGKAGTPNSPVWALLVLHLQRGQVTWPGLPRPGANPRGLPAPQHEVRGLVLGVSGQGGP